MTGSVYHMDLRKISLEQYKQTLKSAELIPSRRILKEDIDRRFSHVQAAGISDVAELLTATKSKARIAELVERTGVSEQYLTLLRREANSLLPKPRNLKDFPGVREAIVKTLAGRGIKNSKQLFDRTCGSAMRTGLAAETGIDPETLLELLRLADLSRVYGVGPVFARLLLDAGVESAAAIAGSSSSRLFKKLAAAYLAVGNTRVDFTERDIIFCIQMAQRLPGSIEL